MNRWKQAIQWCLRHGRRPVALTVCASILWLALWADAHLLFHFSPLTHAICFGLALAVPISWARYWRSRSLLPYRVILSVSFIALWQFAVAAPLVFSAYQLSETLAHAGVAISFVIGLCWAVWVVDRKTKQLAPSPHQQRSWNPLRRWAWYFGRRNPKLWQSTATLGAVVILLTWMYITVLIMLVGGEVNAQQEFQTLADTTVRGPQPQGERGAFVADHVAPRAEKQAKPSGQGDRAEKSETYLRRKLRERSQRH
jgi:hypothetical protein